VHRDVKPHNMMIIKPPDGGKPDCKLIDFGLAEHGVEEMSGVIGSPNYMAPEVHRRTTYTFKADIWSAGVTALELLCEKVPWGTPVSKSITEYRDFSELEELLEDNERWQSRSVEAGEFLARLMQADPAARPTADEALELEWMENFRPESRRFPKAIARSLANYTSAPPVWRCCLLSIAARIGATDMEAIGHAFLGADSDGDGMISQADLEEALEDMDGYKWWCDSASKVQVEDVLEAADLDHQGGLGYTEFVAACLYSRHRSIQELAETAFLALDDDRDDLVRVQDIRKLFRERDRPFLASLPQNRGFAMEEWCSCIEEYGHGSQASSNGEDAQDGLFSFLACGKCHAKN